MNFFRSNYFIIFPASLILCFANKLNAQKIVAVAEYDCFVKLADLLKDSDSIDVTNHNTGKTTKDVIRHFPVEGARILLFTVKTTVYSDHVKTTTIISDRVNNNNSHGPPDSSISRNGKWLIYKKGKSFESKNESPVLVRKNIKREINKYSCDLYTCTFQTENTSYDVWISAELDRQISPFDFDLSLPGGIVEVTFNQEKITYSLSEIKKNPIDFKKLTDLQEPE